MRVELKPHPDTPCSALSRIEVRLSRRDDLIEAIYVAHGDIDKLRLPERVESGRADELWKHTCFELFLRTEGGGNYVELNFSPSTQWAGYGFTGYRTGMTNLDDGPRVSATATAASLEVRATIERAALNDLLSGPLRIGASAVVEEINGDKSFWALAHPHGKPDFHHLDCFALRWG
ncbi:MAG: DOMON-like domain-containing protein [Terricaulis sp.]